MPPMDSETLRRYLEFYQDIGVKSIYRKPGQGKAVEQPAEVRTAVKVAAPVVELPPLAPSDETLLRIIEDIGDCRRCGLHAGRNKIVFGVGNEKAPLVFVGEGP